MRKIHLLRKSERKSVGTTLALTVGSPSFDRRGTMLKHYAFMLLFLLGSLNVWGEVTALSLPKSWDASDGSSAYTEALGCTKTSLGSDYSSAPKLKFNAAGSSLVIQVADAPNKISFNFKQNGTSAGTFKVQESANGTNYTDALTVTWPGNSKTNTPEATLQSTSRYIKLVYVTKGSSTNAAVGGISITKASGAGSTPSVSLEPSSLDLAATGNAQQNITLTASNFSGSVNNVECAFFSAATCQPSEATAQPEWITSLSDNNSNQVSFNVTDNDGAARNIWMKITASDGTGNASAVLAIAQAKYTVDYAELPFAYDGNGSGELPNGFTNSGVGTYSSSPKMKFDGTDDYIIIKINEAPGKLTYDIKNNSFSGGTFTVQESADGETYTNVAIHTEITGTQSEEVALKQATRYVKFIYTKKVSGNVALGNIVISKYVAPAAVEKPTISGETPFLTSTEVTLTQAEADHIYYTTNGDDPTTSSTLYSEPFELNATATIKAIAVKGEDVSAVAEMTFTKATILTVAQAKTAIDAGGDLSNKYVAGIVSQIDTYNSTYNSLTYWISDDGTTANQLQVYSGLAGVVKTAFASTDDIHVGDDVTVKGTLKKYSSTYEFDKNNVIVAYKPIALLSWSAASYDAELGGSNSFPTLTNTNSVSVTYSSSNTDAATIDATTGEISLVAEGSTTIKATFAGNENYKANSVSYSLKVKNAITRADISFEENGGSAVADLTQQTNLPNPLPVITKAGKNFGGWFTDSELETPAVAGAAVTSTAAITLYAKWLDPYTVAEAKVVIDANPTGTENQYVAGIISQIDSYNKTYHSITYWISADGTTTNQLQVYSGLIGNAATALEKEQFTAKTDLELGDAVVVTGTLKLHNETYEFDKNNSIYTFSRKVSAGLAYEITAIQKTVGDDLFTNTLTNPNSVAVTYSSSDENIALVDENTGEVLVGEEGTAKITAAFAGNATYKAAEVSYIVTVSAAADTRKVANSPAKFTTTKGDLDPTDIAFEAFKGGASTAPANYNDGIRLYQASSEDAIGGFITLKAKKGYTIDQVKITTTDTYATTVAYSVDGNEHLLGSGSVAKSGDYSTPSGLNVESVNIVNKGSDKNSRLEIASIKVWYTGDALAVDHYFLGGTYETTFEQNGTFNYTGLKVYASYDAGETITEEITGFVVEADLTTAGSAEAIVKLNDVELIRYDITVTAGKENPALAYTPESVTITAGDAWSAPTLSNTFNVSPITYSSDKESVATVDENGVITLAGGYGTAVITASFAGDDDYIDSEATFTITVNEPAENLSGTWNLVTDAADLMAGMKVIISQSVNASGTIYTMGKQNSNNRAQVESTVDGETLSPAVGTKVITLVDAGNGMFALQTSNGKYLSAAGSGKNNHLKEAADYNSNQEKWTITIADNKAKIQAASTNRNTIRYNSTSSLFSCYAEDGQSAIALYAKPFDYTRNVSGNYATICLPKAGKIIGATLYEIAYYGRASKKIFFDEIVNGEMEAGIPYIFQPAAGVEKINVYYSDNTAEDVVAGDRNGLIGFYDLNNENATLPLADNASLGNYILYQNAYWLVSGRAAYIANYRAYIQLNQITPSEPTLAPGRRRISMSVNDTQTVTGFENAEANEAPHKVLINGELFILRGEKMYDAKGQLVK